MRTFEDRLLLVLTAYSLLILFLTPTPPMTDFPSHLATAAVLRDFGDSPFRSAFQTHGWLNSNRLFALIGALTPRPVPIPLVGKFALSAWLVLPLVGRRYLATWRPEAVPWAPLLALLSFSNPFNAGYVPFLLGVPLGLLALALPWAAQERPALHSLVLPAALLVLSLYAHLLPYLGAAAGVAATCFAVRPSVRAWGSRVLVLLPSLGLFLAIFIENHGRRGSDIAPVADVWSPARHLYEKAISVADVFVSFRVTEEIAFFGVAMLVLLVLGVLGLATRRGRPRRGPVVMAAVLVGLVLLCPTYLLGAERTDGRFLPFAIAAWLSLLPAWEGRRLVIARRAILVVLTGPPLLWAHAHYRMEGDVVDRVRRALRAVPPESVLKVAFETYPLPGAARVSPLLHVGAYYLVERKGFAVGSLITHRKWHMVTERPAPAGHPTFVAILGARSVRDLVPPGDRIFDDGGTIIVREEVAKTLGDRLSPQHLLMPEPIGGPRRRLPILGIERPTS